MLETIRVRSMQRDEMKDITNDIRRIVNESNVKEGIVYIYCAHTTAGITINENADPDVQKDMLMRWDEIYPWEHPKYRHSEGNSASHLKASTVGSSQMVIINNKELILGTWQGIYLCEFDGPRQRQVYVKIIKS